MQWKPISECDLDCFEDLDVVAFLFKGNDALENYEFDGGLFLQPQKFFSWGRTLGYLKKQGATHFMIYEFPKGENCGNC